jgi:hypothetical protein
MVKNLPKGFTLRVALALWLFSATMGGAQTVDPNLPALGVIWPELNQVTTVSSNGLFYITGPPGAITQTTYGIMWGNGSMLDGNIPQPGTIYYQVDNGPWTVYNRAVSPVVFSVTNTQIQVYGTIGGQVSQTNTYVWAIQYNDLLLSPANYTYTIDTNGCAQRSAAPTATYVFTNSVTVTAQTFGPNSCSFMSYTPPPLQVSYNTDGSDNWISYTAPITLTNSTTLYWMAARQGCATQYATSAYAAFINVGMVPGGGSFQNPITETINTAGAAVQYSVNGSDWAAYTGPFTVDGNDPRNPAGYGQNNPGSSVQLRYLSGGLYVTNTYTPCFSIAPLVTSPALNNIHGGWAAVYELGYQDASTPFLTNFVPLEINSPVTLTASTATAGATIWYSYYTDYSRQDQYYSNGVDSHETNVYTGPLTISSRAYLNFEATKTNYYRWSSQDWDVQYTFLTPLSAPVFSVTGGTFSNQFTLTLTESNSFEPTSSQAFYLGTLGYYAAPQGPYTVNGDGSISQNFTVSGTGTYTASIVPGSWGETSPSASAAFNFLVNEMVTTANQTFVQSPLAVSAGSPTQSTDYPGFAVYHTTDGTLPTVLSGFAQTFEITNTTTVVWEGYRNGYTPQYVTNTYTYAGPVMASPSPGTYDQNINVTLTGPVGSSVTYSLDGTNWLSYTGPVSLAGYVDASITIQATYSGGPTSQFVYSFAGGASSSYAGLAPFLFQTPQYCTSVGGIYYITNMEMEAAGFLAVWTDANGDPSGLPFSSGIYYRIDNGAWLSYSGGYLPFSSAVNTQLDLTGYVTGQPTQTNTYKFNVSEDDIVVQPNAGYAYTNQGTILIGYDAANGNQPIYSACSQRSASPNALYVFTNSVSVTAYTLPNNSCQSMTTLPCQLWYNTDGSSNWTLYTGPITLTSSTTLYWKRTRPGYVTAYATSSYAAFLNVGMFPGGGVFQNAVTETINAAGATVQYGVNGSAWAAYTGPFTVDGNDPRNPAGYGQNNPGSTVQLRYLSGGLYVTNTYNPLFCIAPLVGSPALNNIHSAWTAIYELGYVNTANPFLTNFSPLEINSPVTLTVSTATAGATIWYQYSSDYLHQDQYYSNSVDSHDTLVYSGPITITNRAYLEFQATKPNYYRWGNPDWDITYCFLTPLSQPVFSAPGGSVFTNQYLLTVTEPNAYLAGQVAFYLGNGEGYYLQPTGTAIVNGDGSVSQNYWIFGSDTYTATVIPGGDGETAPPASATYTFVVNELVTTPSQNFQGALPIRASSANGTSDMGNWVIYYTTNGTLPTVSSPQYSSALTLTNTTTVIWMGYRPSFTPQYITNIYTYMSPVSVSPGPGLYNQAIDLVLTPANSGIAYSLDGINWLNYTSPIHLDGYGNGTATLQAYYPGGFTNQYTYTFQASAPQVSPASTNFNGAITVTAVPGASGGSITYSITDQNGNLVQDTTNYSGPISNTNTAGYTFQVFKAGYTPSIFTLATYVSMTPTLLMVTNLSTLTIYTSQQAGSPWWQIYAGNSPNNLSTAMTYAYTMPGQTASLSLVNAPYTYYSCYITTNGGTNALVIPLTMVQNNTSAVIWSASYNGQGNTNTTSYQNPGVTTIVGLTNATVQTAQNPSPGQMPVFQYTPWLADPLTAQLLNGVLWMNSNQDYLVSMNGSVSGNYELAAELRQLPSNDDLTNAITWAVNASNNLPISLSSMGYNIYASTETGEQMVMGGKTVWYQITPAQGGTFMAQVTPYSDTRLHHGANLRPINFELLNPEMTIWQGTNMASLTLVADSKVPNPSTSINPYNFPSQIGCVMAASNTYYLRIDASGSPGEYDLTKSFDPNAANDNFASAQLLLSTVSTYDNGIRYRYAITSGNYGATTEAGEPLADSHSVWFEIITPSSGYLASSVISTVQSNAAAVYQYLIPSNSVAAVSNVVALPQGAFLPAGTAVYLAVCSTATNGTTFDFSATLTEPPANDYTTNALILSGDEPNTTLFSVYDSYSKADESLDEQIPGALNSIWWTVTPNNPGTLTVQNPDGNYPNTYWMLFENGQQLPVFDSRADRRTYQLNDVAAYLFKLTEPDANVGDGQLNFMLEASPTNYENNPTPITSYTMVPYANGPVYSYSLAGIDNATNQAGAPFNHAVWYSWEPPLPNSGLAQVSLTSSLVSYQVTLDGNGLATNPIPCAPADNLLIAVGGSIDTYILGIDFRSLPSNDELANAIPVPLGQDFLFYTKYGTMSTNVFGTNTVQGAADLWCIYDPHNESNASFYISPITNGPSITLQVIQDNQVLGQETVDLMNDPPLNITFTNLDTAVLRIIVAQPNTDVSLTIQSQARNDNFANAEVINLVPSSQTVAVAGGTMTLTEYTSHIVSDNANATLEPGEPFSGFFTRDPGDLAGQSLWWQVTTPVQGIFSIKTRATSVPLDIEVTQSNTLPHSIYDFIAWNSTTMTQNSLAADGTVVFTSSPGQSYWIRIDTLVGSTGRVDFDVSQIQMPAGDDVYNPLVLSQTGGPQTSYYLGQYPSTTGGYSYGAVATIYGATREYIQGFLEDASKVYLSTGTGPLSQQYALGELPLYPAWQTLWYTFTPSATTRYVIQNSANFTPIILLTQSDPTMLGGSFANIDNNSEVTLLQGQTYYFTVDALVPPAATFSGNPIFFQMSALQLCDDPIDVGLQGLNSDINRDCEDSIPGVISLSLVPSAVPANDSILTPIALNLSEGYVQDSCVNPFGNYFVRYAEENTNATAETDPNYVDADYMGGAGKTLWWTITPTLSGPLYIDTSASQMPVIIKIFSGNDFSLGSLFSSGQADYLVQAGVPYLIGMDSAAGTSGMMAFTIYQTPTSPVNDMFSSAEEITTPQVCGTLNYSTIEQFESIGATGSIWYRVENYTQTNEAYAFQLTATNALMDLYQNNGGPIQNSIPETLGASNFNWVAQPGEQDYIRVWTTNSPAMGSITINSTFDPTWYAGQEYITPSGYFVGYLTIQANSQSSALPFVYYSPANTTTNSTVYTGPFTITNSQTIDFMVVIQNIMSYHVTNTYIQLPDEYITPSCAFTNQMLVSVLGVPSDKTVAYMQGPPDGSPPQQQPWLLFPSAGIEITNSAEVDFIVSGVGAYTSAQQHYTNTVAAPQIVASGPFLAISSATPLASLQIQQGNLLINCATNYTNILALAPQVEVTASRAGWLPSTVDYTFSPVVTNLAAIQVATNSQTLSDLKVTLTNPNGGTVIWYNIKQGGNTLVSTSSSMASVTLDLNFGTCDVQAYAGTAALSSVGPSTALHFTATLLTPQMSEINNQLVIVNPNTIPSDLNINSIDIGTNSQYTLPVQVGVMDKAYATSALANPSSTNSFTPESNLGLAVSPSGETFNSDLSVSISTGEGSLNVVVSETGLAPVTYPNANNPNVGNTLPVTLDRSATIVASVLLYGALNAPVTNVYQAQVGPVQSTMPGFIDSNGTYDSQTPVVLGCVTPNVTYDYQIGLGGGWTALPGNQLKLQNGTYTYQVMAIRDGWASSSVLQFTCTAGTGANSLVNYVANFYTIFPGNPSIPATIIATNSALVNYPPYSYENLVWTTGTSPADTLVISTPGNYPVYHQVIQRFEQSESVFIETDGPTNLTYVTVSLFDWTVVPIPGSTNDLGLVVSSDTNISDNIFFYKPTWIQSRTNLPLQAIVTNSQGNVVGYIDLTPLRNPADPTMVLIPGNLYTNSDRINLRYWVPSGNGFTTNYFSMRFQTLTPSQYQSTNNPNDVIVLISPDYMSQDVGVFYTTNNSPPLNLPFNNPVAMLSQGQTIFGTVGLSNLMYNSSNVWMFNSQYHVNTNSLSLYLTNGIPPLPIYGQ